MPRVKKFNQEEILNKATDLFWKQGYHATSIQNLVTHLGINRASLYDTYGGKRELFDKSFEHYRSKNLEGLTKFLGQFPKVKDGFKALFDRAIQESIVDKDRKGCFVVNTVTEFIPGDDAMEITLKQNEMAYEKVFQQYLMNGVDSGQISKSKDINSLGGLIYTLFSGIKVVSKIQPNKEKLNASIEVALSLLD